MRVEAGRLDATIAAHGHWALLAVAVIPFQWWWLVALLLMAWWVLGRVRRRPRPAGVEDIIRFGRLLVIPLTGGLSLAGSLILTSREAHPQLGAEVSQVLRRSRQAGLAQALAASGGHLGELFGRMAGAHASGSSLVRAVIAHVDNLHHRHRTDALARIRSLPVTLAVPLTLLIIPGFLLVLVGPPVVSRVSEILSGLVGA